MNVSNLYCMFIKISMKWKARFVLNLEQTGCFLEVLPSFWLGCCLAENLKQIRSSRFQLKQNSGKTYMASRAKLEHFSPPPHCLCTDPPTNLLAIFLFLPVLMLCFKPRTLVMAVRGSKEKRAGKLNMLI